MEYYYYEVEDPQNPGQTIRAYFSDDESTQDDLIYRFPGGIYQYDKYKLVLDLIGQAMKEQFLDNKTHIDIKGNKFTPKLEESQYVDPELARIERANKPIQVEFTPADTTELKKAPHIKIEGAYKPKPVLFTKMMDYDQLPKIAGVDQANQDHYQQVAEALPNLTQIKRGMHLKITGKHLRIRPTDTQEEGFYLNSDTGKRYDMTDFLQVNSNSVLLWAVPKDLPTGRYRLHIVSGWYADPSIARTGHSKVIEVV